MKTLMTAVLFLATAANFVRGDDPELTTLKGHKGEVRRAVFSPDGKMLASSGSDSDVHLWSVPGGKSLGVLKGHRSSVYRPAFSPDGKLLATPSKDGTTRLWRVSDQKVLHTFKSGEHAMVAVAFSPDGKRLAVGSGGGQIKLWDVSTGEEKVSCVGLSAMVPENGLTFTPNGKVLIAGSSDDSVRMWNAETGKRLTSLLKQGTVSTVRMSGDGKMFLVAQEFPDSKEIAIRDAANGKQLTTLKDGVALTPEARFSPDGKVVIGGIGGFFGGVAPRIGVWTVDDGKKASSLTMPSMQRVSSLAISTDGKVVAVSCAFQPRVVICRIKADHKLEIAAELQEHTKGVPEVVFSPDGKVMATASLDGTLKLWDVSKAIDKP